MAEKLSIRERARIALGDFDFTLDMLHEKMSEIFKEEAKARGLDDTSIGIAAAIIARDGNLKALGRERIEDIFLSSDAEAKRERKDNDVIEKAAHDFGALYSSLKADKQGEEKPKRKPIKEAAAEAVKPCRNSHIISAEKKAENPKEDKRKRGRPKKHKTGSRQTSILFSDEMREAVNQYAQFYRCSFSDAVNKLLEMAIRGRA